MEDHSTKALAHLEAALEEGDGPMFELGAAGIHAVLHLAETIRHGIRDVVYEMRD